MISIDGFELILQRIANSLPGELFENLNGGILLLPDVNYHPNARDRDLFIMGTYHTDPVYGRYISIYYGSFQAVYGEISVEELQVEIERVLKHEFLHHLESQAGIRDLEIKDRMNLQDYEMNVRRINRDNGEKDG